LYVIYNSKLSWQLNAIRFGLIKHGLEGKNKLHDEKKRNFLKIQIMVSKYSHFCTLIYYFPVGPPLFL
jgi:hypothetical protein